MSTGFSILEVERRRHRGAVSVRTRFGSQVDDWDIENQPWQELLQEAKKWRESAERRRNLASTYEGPVPHEKDSQMGAKILSTLLPSQNVRFAFLREIVESKATIRFSILGQDRELISIPWETCSNLDWLTLEMDPSRFRRQNQSELVILRTPVHPRWDTHVLEEPIQIMVVASTPRGILLTNYTLEEKLIRQSLQPPVVEERFGFVRLEALNELDLKDRVKRHNPHVLHIMAHGEDGKLLAQDMQDNLVRLDGRRIAAILKESSSTPDAQRKLVLFFSTACELMRDTSDAFTREMGPALADLVPFSIGMQLPVSPDAAQLFTREFYAAIGRSQSIIDSFVHARQQLLHSFRGSPLWVAPVLYVSSYHDCVLFELDDALYRLERISQNLEEPIKALNADVENKDALDEVLAQLLALDEFYEDFKKSSIPSHLEVRGALANLVELADDQAMTNLRYVKKYVETRNDEWFFDKKIPERSRDLKKALRQIRDDIEKLCKKLRGPSSHV